MRSCIKLGYTAGMLYWTGLWMHLVNWQHRMFIWKKIITVALIPTAAGYENRNVCPVQTDNPPLSLSPDYSYPLTSRLGGLQHHPNKLGHVKVGCVVQGPHVSPAWAKVGISTQGKELASKAGCCLCITWTTEKGYRYECVRSECSNRQFVSSKDWSTVGVILIISSAYQVIQDYVQWSEKED